jgi:hypothetical protein
MFRDALDWPLPLSALAASGLLAGVLLIPEALRTKERRRTALALALFAVSVGSLLQYPFLPFSATTNRPSAAPTVAQLQRHFVFVFAVLLALVPLAWASRATRLASIALVCTLLALGACAARGRGVASGPELLPGAAAFAIGIAASRIRPWLARALAALAAAAGLGWLAVRWPARHVAQGAAVYGFAPNELNVGAGWRVLESLPPGSRVAAFQSMPADYALTYPLYGRRFQLRPVSLRRDGSSAMPLHLAEPADWWQPWNEVMGPLDSGSFLAALEEQSIDAVVVSRLGLQEWPPQRAVLAAAPRALALFEDSCSAVFRLPARVAGR